MALAGKAAKVSVCATEGGSYTELDGCNGINYDPSFDLLETTNFKQTSGSDDYTGAKIRIMGLTDCDVSLDCDYVPTDANGQALIIARCAGGASAGTSIWVKFLPTGVAASGWRVECLCAMSIKTSPSDKVTVSYKLTCVSKIQADNAA